MRTGRLRHLVQILDYTETQDSLGQETKAYTTTTTVWAAIEPVRGEEREIAQQVQSGITHDITIRYIDGVTAKTRIGFGDRTFEIVEVLNPEERNIVLLLKAKELT